MKYELSRKNKKGRAIQKSNFQLRRLSKKENKIIDILDKLKNDEHHDNTDDLLEIQKNSSILINNDIDIYEAMRELSKKINMQPKNNNADGDTKESKELNKTAQFLGRLEKYEEDNRLHVGYFTERDENVVDILDPRKNIQKFLDFLDSIPGKMDYAYNKYYEADKKRVDFEHNIELYYENCYQTWLIARMFKYTLMERRDYKNLRAALAIVKRFYDEHKKTIDTLRSVVKMLDDLEDLKENRYYCPRSDLNLPVNRPFRELPEEKQKMLLKNLEIAQGK